MRPDDLLHFSSTNLDHLTETYNIGFYLEYLTKWPELCQVIESSVSLTGKHACVDLKDAEVAPRTVELITQRCGSIADIMFQRSEPTAPAWPLS